MVEGFSAETEAVIGDLYPSFNMVPEETRFIRIGNETFASKRGSSKYFYHNDHLGGVNVITDINGSGVQLSEYGPWGGVSRQESNTDPTHRFTGKELDPESGLYYYGGRYYDPVLSRFISPDPFVPQPSDPQSLNRYSYVLNNPVNLVDPDGHFFWAAIVAIAKVIAAVVAKVAALIGTVASGVWAALNAPLVTIAGGEAGASSITVGQVLGVAGAIRMAADLMQRSSRGSPGGWGGIGPPVTGPPGTFASAVFGQASGADCEVCPVSGLDFLRSLITAREVAAASTGNPSGRGSRVPRPGDPGMEGPIDARLTSYYPRNSDSHGENLVSS